MALRNAFEDIATEVTLRRVLAAVNFARDISDRMRVIVDSGTVALTTSTALVGYIQGTHFGAAGAVPMANAQGSPNAMDAREPQRQNSLMYGEQVRQRWTYT